MGASKGQQRNFCCHGQREEYGCCCQRGWAGPPCQVFCPHQPSGFECATREPCPWQRAANCCLLSPKLHSHSGTPSQTDTTGASSAQVNVYDVCIWSNAIRISSLHMVERNPEQQSAYGRTQSGTAVCIWSNAIRNSSLHMVERNPEQQSAYGRTQSGTAVCIWSNAIRNSSLHMVERNPEQQSAYGRTQSGTAVCIWSNTIRNSSLHMVKRNPEQQSAYGRTLSGTAVCIWSNAIWNNSLHMVKRYQEQQSAYGQTQSGTAVCIWSNAIRNSTSEYNHLLESTGFDPRFLERNLEKDQRKDVFHRLKEKVVLLWQNHILMKVKKVPVATPLQQSSLLTRQTEQELS
ncbi:uncharacterized protein LOC114841034 [Esox lucius]|uniref:uncharacterized protein LOC114841034 n=1 Tax=Esox lucius TaxID=8010 RepID=UPI0014773A89|nr:uncharacterized protein LOC114841034 [Esox lucius]